jgi:hypothetical protein
MHTVVGHDGMQFSHPLGHCIRCVLLAKHALHSIDQSKNRNHTRIAIDWIQLDCFLDLIQSRRVGK